MKKTITFLLCIIVSFNSFTQIVTIPDAKFKAALVANSLINTNADTEIQVSEANAFTGGLVLYYDSISDLTGIASFINLTDLNCVGNQLTSLDLSSNTALTGLSCALNQLTNLNISANTALTYLYCSTNQLASLDVSTNTALTSLDCGANPLTSLDISSNITLIFLSCGQSQLTSLDVSNNTALTSLICNFSQLTSLDVSTNTALTNLNCMVNQITSLDVSTNNALTYLYCNENKLSNLNVHGANALTKLLCYKNNGYSNLDISGATNLKTLSCFYSPNLHCIQVANVAAANAQADWHKDSIASYSINCATSVSNSELISFCLYPNPANNTLNIRGLQKGDELQLFNIYGQLLLSENCSNDSNKLLDIHSLSNGIYTMQFKRNNTKYLRKFIKESY
ncbi:MAG TPA: T9SS type A sorting domain-containing protein [Chitinophagaceae bacterium]|nr:T9SS type A sorting domain-containing protein [Chitinophagaceae bacterium]